MKSKIDLYTLRLIRDHIVYFPSFAFFIILLTVFLPWQMREYFGIYEKIAVTNKEIIDLQKQVTIVYSFEPNEVDQLVLLLDKLLPKSEDYYSIFRSLNSLALKTGVNLRSYSIPFSPSSSEKTVVNVIGQGTPELITNFLNSYQYTSGRLITMDNIQFSPETSELSFTLNFYSKNIPDSIAAVAPKVDKKLVDLIEKINLKLNQSALPEEPSNVENIYTPKSNPFEP